MADRNDEAYSVFVDFLTGYDSKGEAQYDRVADSAAVTMSKEWQVYAVDYTDERRRLKDPKAVTSEMRDKAMPAELKERLVREISALEGFPLPPQTVAE